MPALGMASTNADRIEKEIFEAIDSDICFSFRVISVCFGWLVDLWVFLGWLVLGAARLGEFEESC